MGYSQRSFVRWRATVLGRACGVVPYFLFLVGRKRALLLASSGAVALGRGGLVFFGSTLWSRWMREFGIAHEAARLDDWGETALWVLSGKVRKFHTLPLSLNRVLALAYLTFAFSKTKTENRNVSISAYSRSGRFTTCTVKKGGTCQRLLWRLLHRRQLPSSAL